MDYFKYKEVCRVVEGYSKEGLKEFYPSLIKESIDVEPSDYMPALENLVDVGVLKRKFVTDVNEDGEHSTEIDAEDLDNHSEEEVYVKYEILEEFSLELTKAEEA